MRSQTLRLITVCLAAVVMAVSCASQVFIPEDLSAPEMVQRAQEASDRNRYNIALQYYEAILLRNPYNADYICAAEYEIAFIHYKQKKYAQARSEFNMLLERYNTPDAELLPPQFKILARKVLESIDDKESRSRKR
jgi:outer membrane protein assembly factor BamD (BamD/ComL family)